MTNLEKEAQDTLNSARETLGDSIPRLINETPQVETHGLKHGLTGQYTYLTAAEMVEYAKTAAAFFKDSTPIGMREIHLLQCIVDTSWRLSRIPALTASLQFSKFTIQAQHLAGAHPETDARALEPYAHTEAFHLGADALAKLARYSTTLSRQLLAMSKEYDRMRLFRRDNYKSDPFNLEECEPYKKYQDLLTVATRLFEARQELKQKTAKATAPVESTDSGTNLVRKTVLRIINPLTKKTRESLEMALEWGLLDEMELTLFPEKKVAWRN